MIWIVGKTRIQTDVNFIERNKVENEQEEKEE